MAKERLLDFSPLYLQLHIIIQTMGLPMEHTVQFFHIILLIISGFFLFQILEHYFSPAVAFIGMILFFFDRHILIFSGILEPEIFIVFFISGFLYFSLGKNLPRIFISGIFFSLILLTRANLFILFFMALIFLWQQRWKEKKQKHRAILFFSLPVILTLLGLSIRNAAIQSTFSPVVMNPGTVIYEGNNPCSSGKSAVYPLLIKQMAGEFPNRPDYMHVLYREFPSRILNRRLTISEANSYWVNKIKNYISDHPHRFLGLLGTKLNFFFHNFMRHDIALSLIIDRRLQNFWFPGIPFFIISGLAVVGMFLEKKNWREKLLIYSGFFLQLAALLVTYVSARQRCALIPFFIIFAASTIHYLIKNRKKILVIILILIPLCFLFQLKNDLIDEEEHLWMNQIYSSQLRNMAFKFRERDQLEKAIYLSCQSYSYSPWLFDWLRIADLPYGENGFKKKAISIHLLENKQDFSSLLDRATLFLKAGMSYQAEGILDILAARKHRFLRNFEQSSEIYFFKARARAQQGDTNTALSLFYRGLERSPGEPYILSHIFALTENPVYLEKLKRYLDDINAYFFIGKAFIENKKYQKAIKYLDYVTEKIPEFRRAWVYYAVALGEAGQVEEAVASYTKALKNNRDPVFFEKEILKFSEKWYLNNKKNLSALLFYSSVLKQMGYFEKALIIQKQARELDPNNPEILKQISFLEKWQN
jgi:tetratricopeptide (TPR) repeat protein